MTAQLDHPYQPEFNFLFVFELPKNPSFKAMLKIFILYHIVRSHVEPPRR